MARTQYLTPIIDNGHGSDTSGKRSPKWDDSTPQLFEWEFNRDIAFRICKMLQADGLTYHLLVPENCDISLSERCTRANKVNKVFGGNTFLVSIHANAGGGTGWEVFTSKGKTKADDIAKIIFNHVKAEFPGEKMRTDFTDGDPDKEADFYILKHTTMPAVLTENWFMDNHADCVKLNDDAFRERIARAHFEAIRYIATTKPY